MALPPNQRFAAPARPIPAPRAKAGGLGSDRSEYIPDGDDPQGRGAFPEQPHAFTGVRSRSRFAPEPKPNAIGHGAATAGVSPLATLPEPNLETQFEPHVPTANTELPARAERMASLGQQDPLLVRIGRLIFHRDRDTGGEHAPGGGKTKAYDLIRWSDFGVVPGKINRRYTLRPEFSQGAQTFLGARMIQTKRAATSTSPVSMLPPRTSRLTERSLPASFGQTTEVLNG